jgi:outer membrane protein W
MFKKSCIFLLTLLGLCGVLYGQSATVLEVRGGYMNPKDAAAGLIIGVGYGILVDERVDIGLGIDYFHKNYKEETKVADQDYQSGVHESTVIRELEYSTHLLPVSANVTVHLPFQPPLYWYVGGSVSYQFLFNEENNYVEAISEKRTYRGWGWMIRAGIDYNIGSRSSLMLEAFYNSCKVKANEEKKEGLPVWEEVDVSGLGFRAGLRLEFF